VGGTRQLLRKTLGALFARYRYFVADYSAIYKYEPQRPTRIKSKSQHRLWQLIQHKLTYTGGKKAL